MAEGVTLIHEPWIKPFFRCNMWPSLAATATCCSTQASATSASAATCRW